MIELSDEEILPLSLKHNFWTWSAQKHVHPIPVKKAKGVYFWDVSGKRYLDLNSMVMCANIGHGDERIINAIIDQVRELPFAGPDMATKPRAVLGQVLTEVTSGNLSYFLYTSGGADANENAVKLARAYTGRLKILSRYRSYHGASLGAIALTGDPRRLAWEPGVAPGVVHFLDPFRYRSTFHRTNPGISESDFAIDYLNHLEEIIKFEGPQTIAGVLIEPVTGTNGIIVPPEGYLQGVRKLCDQYGLLLIVDEVMSGFGRTGEWFAVDHWGVSPDIMTMAKGLTSGYAPLGAVGMTAKIAEFFNDRVYQGGLTYNGHPISLAAAVAVIQAIKEDNMVGNSKRVGIFFKDRLVKLMDLHPSIGDVRSIGLFGAIELVKNRQTKEPLAPYNCSSPEMERLKTFLFQHGVYVHTHWNTILIIPPIIISETQLQEGLDVIDEALNEIEQTLS
jgi:taurine---2-oxoglutarate transaminase